MDFETFLKRTRLTKDKKVFIPPKSLVAFDPGETTGYACFTDGKLSETGELNTDTIQKAIEQLNNKIVDAEILVYEDYKVYGWKTDQHTWNELHTPRVLGVIETIAATRNVLTFKQMAQLPKGFCTDDKLKMWGYYQVGKRHARDAIRHGCYYLLFNHGKIPKKK